MLHCVLVLFFKQKTAYEMRISDWSSDVCSSDLTIMGQAAPISASSSPFASSAARSSLPPTCFPSMKTCGTVRRPFARSRSEEHTSELQSLMRISYAVFCLKKKKKITYHTTNQIQLNTSTLSEKDIHKQSP